MGEWLPVLSRALAQATGVWDWNIVQNNGENHRRMGGVLSQCSVKVRQRTL